jgi:hypothetical protein
MLILSLTNLVFFLRGQSRRPKAHLPQLCLLKPWASMVCHWGKLTCSISFQSCCRRQCYMSPLDAMKAPQGKKTLEVCQSRPARGGGGLGKQSHGRDYRTPAQTWI